MIHAFLLIALSLNAQASFVSFGDHTVCRHENARGEDDTLEGTHFARIFGINSIEECQKACIDHPIVCWGIEYLSHDHRCEVWIVQISHADQRVHDGVGQFFCQNNTAAFGQPEQGPGTSGTSNASFSITQLWWLLPVILATIVVAAACQQCRREKDSKSSKVPPSAVPPTPTKDLTLNKLKEALEGAREQEHTAPDVYLTILEVHVLHKGQRIADLSTFSLRGLECKARFEVTGTPAQLAGMITADAASWVFAAASAGETAVGKALGVNMPGLGQKVATAAVEAQNALAEKATKNAETKSVDFDIIVNLEKTYGEEVVAAKVQVVSSSVEAVSTVMSINLAVRCVEDMLSRRVTAFISSWWKENVPMSGESDNVV